VPSITIEPHFQVNDRLYPVLQRIDRLDAATAQTGAETVLLNRQHRTRRAAATRHREIVKEGDMPKVLARFLFAGHGLAFRLYRIKSYPLPSAYFGIRRSLASLVMASSWASMSRQHEQPSDAT
jgi:hypothetical protein